MYFAGEDKKVRPISFKNLNDCHMSDAAFGGWIEQYLMCTWSEFRSSYKFEFDNIISSYPAHNAQSVQNRKYALVETEYNLVSRILGPEMLQSISRNHEKLMKTYICRCQIREALVVLQNQIGIEEKVDINDLHWVWKLTLVPQRGQKPNTFVVQASVSADFKSALDIGVYVSESDELSGKKCNDQGVTENFESLCLSIPENYYVQCYNLGVSLDSVRTFLAQWVLSHDSIASAASWHPCLPNEEISFLLSDDDFDFSETEDIFSLICVFQNALLEHLSQNGKQIISCYAWENRKFIWAGGRGNIDKYTGWDGREHIGR